jgi:hypothetical protein
MIKVDVPGQIGHYGNHQCQHHSQCQFADFLPVEFTNKKFKTENYTEGEKDKEYPIFLYRYNINGWKNIPEFIHIVKIHNQNSQENHSYIEIHHRSAVGIGYGGITLCIDSVIVLQERQHHKGKICAD